jgi:hypothetical protein
MCERGLDLSYTVEEIYTNSTTHQTICLNSDNAQMIRPSETTGHC